MEIHEKKDGMLRAMETVPTQAYWGMALGSIAISALLYFSGRRTAALFVGQWPPTFLALALLYKVLRPSQEQAGSDMTRAMREMAEAAR